MRKALLVDDSEEDRILTKRVIAKHGYYVATASSYEEFIEKYADAEFDVAVIDGLFGKCFEVYKKSRAKRKLIFSSDDRIIEEAKKKGLPALLKSIKDEEFVKFLENET